MPFLPQHHWVVSPSKRSSSNTNKALIVRLHPKATNTKAPEVVERTYHPGGFLYLPFSTAEKGLS